MEATSERRRASIVEALQPKDAGPLTVDRIWAAAALVSTATKGSIEITAALPYTRRALPSIHSHNESLMVTRCSRTSMWS